MIQYWRPLMLLIEPLSLLDFSSSSSAFAAAKWPSSLSKCYISSIHWLMVVLEPRKTWITFNAGGSSSNAMHLQRPTLSSCHKKERIWWKFLSATSSCLTFYIFIILLFLFSIFRFLEQFYSFWNNLILFGTIFSLLSFSSLSCILSLSSLSCSRL